jgi:hypothetical protein
VEEKLLVDRYDKWLNVPDREKKTKQRWGKRFRTGADVRRLADLASSFILSFCVGVTKELSKEQNGQGREGKS